MDSFPEYIPIEVQEHFRECASSIADCTQQSIPIYEAMLTNKRMEKVWRSITKRAEAQGNPKLVNYSLGENAPATLPVRYMYEVFSALDDFELHLKRTPSEVKQAYKMMADRLERLSEDMKALPTDVGDFLTTLEDSVFFLIDHEKEYKDGIYERLGIAENPIYTLKAWSDALRERAENYQSLITKVNTKTAERTYMIKRLGLFMMVNFGSFLADNIARTVSVVFGEEIGQKHVRNILSTMK